MNGLPFWLLRFFGIESGYLLLWLPRLVLFFMSLGVDFLVSSIAFGYKEMVLVVFSSFWPVIVFHTRSFSNTLETFALALAFYVYFRVLPINLSF